MKSTIESILSKAGFIRIGFLNQKDARLADWITPWLTKGNQGDMKWMEQHRYLRQHPCEIIPNGKSIISIAYPYYTVTPDEWADKNPISNYAWGADYHSVLRKILKRVMVAIKTEIPTFQGRYFVDSAPLPEKIIAAKCGLGWIGKNSMLINRHHGSYLFLAEIVTNMEFQSTPPTKEYCGTCSKCIEACPTGAILNDRVIDSRKCISFLTIEKKGEFNEKEKRCIDYQLFGCDICQKVCPWNKTLELVKDSPFNCFEKFIPLSTNQWSDLNVEQFEELKIQSPIKRAKLDGIRRNANAILDNHQVNENG